MTSAGEKSGGRWAGYYEATSTRLPRRFLTDALERRVGEPGFAIDLGCGAGVETIALLEAGWTVLAIDQEADAIDWLATRARPNDLNLQLMRASFEGLALPPSDLIFAGLSLPFCHPSHFPRLWLQIKASLHPGALFVGDFFGVRDSWHGNSAMTFHSVEDLKDLLHRFTTEELEEIEADGQAYSGPKHWHRFEVVAIRS
jgi:SAM-dependent methyltransferase